MFKVGLLKILDTDDALIINTFRINTEFHKNLQSGAQVKFSKLTSFLDPLEEDANGNIVVTIQVAGNEHQITLNSSHRPRRRATTTRVQEINCHKFD